MLEIILERDDLLEQKRQNDEWWHELDFGWTNVRQKASR